MKQAELLILKTKIEQLIKDKRTLEEEFELLKKGCTHLNFDGTSAIQSGYFCSSCDICGWNDYGAST